MRWPIVKTNKYLVCMLLLVFLSIASSCILFRHQHQIYNQRNKVIQMVRIKSTLEHLSALVGDVQHTETAFNTTHSPVFMRTLQHIEGELSAALSQLHNLERETGVPEPGSAVMESVLRAWLNDAAAGKVKPVEKLGSRLAALTDLETLRISEQSRLLMQEMARQDALAIALSLIYVTCLSYSIFLGLVFLKSKEAAANCIKVQLEVAEALMQSSDFAEAAPIILAAIGTRYDFASGVLWLADDHKGRIKPFSVWAARDFDAGPLNNQIIKSEFEKGMDIAGHVWQSGEPLWFEFDDAEQRFAWREAARTAGLRSGLAFPIVVEDKVAGVVELHATGVIPRHDDLMRLLAPFGYTIGQYIAASESRRALVEDARIAHFAAEVGRTMSGGAALTTMLKECADLSAEFLGSKFAAAWTVSSDASCLELVASAGVLEASRYLAVIPLAKKTIEALKDTDGNFVQAGRLLFSMAGLEAQRKNGRMPLLAQPLLVDSQLVGVIAVLPGEAQRFSGKAMQNLFLVSRTIAMGVARRRVEGKMAASDALFTQITNNVEELIWVTCPGGQDVSWISPSLANFLGCNQAQTVLVPELALEAIHPDDRQRAFEFFASSSARPSGMEYRQKDARGNWHWMWARLYPALNENGKVGKVYGIASDISAKKETEKQVREFYSMVSHELRTPLTSVYASLRLLEGGLAGTLSAKSLEFVKIARAESDRLIRLINDILDLGKLDAGMLELKLKEVDIQSLIEQSLEGMAGMAQAAGVSMQTQYLWSGTIKADPDRMIQMLENLLSNAIKYSPAGGVVSVVVDRPQEVVRISVADQGEGIPSEQIGRLFGKFQQLDSSDTRLKGGTGLGLAITKAIAERHGGTVGVSSVVGEGSEFWIELPSGEEDKQVLTIPRVFPAISA